jgi:hypothetical protein
VVTQISGLRSQISDLRSQISAPDHPIRHLPRPRPVILRQEDLLPGAEDQAAVLDEEGLAGAGEEGLEVGVGVALVVAVVAVAGDQAAEGGRDVALDGGGRRPR